MVWMYSFFFGEGRSGAKKKQAAKAWDLLLPVGED
tara:strand:+ start:1657 stop:1761 length:105 start_codon:yes stop_codon:yes gene_type:complete